MGALSTRAFFALTLALCTACVPTFDDNLSLITDTQVLAISSEPAEAAPGEEVRLSALAAVPGASGASPRLSWGLCIARKPLTELGPVNPACVRAPSASSDASLALGAGSSVKATLPMDACRLFGPSLPEPMNGEPSGRPVDPDPTGGFYQPVSVTLLEDSVTTLGAVRIFCPPSGLDQEQSADFNAAYRRNQNPVIDQIASLGEGGEASPVPDEPSSLRVAAGRRVALRATWAICLADAACSGAETYPVFNFDSRELDTRHESIRVSWFASAGHFDNAVTGRDENEFATATTDNTWLAPSQIGTTRLWLVIRDARGGQSFRTFEVSVQGS